MWYIHSFLSLVMVLSRIQVTGGSLEESKEALAIAETDGLYCGCWHISIFFIYCLMNFLFYCGCSALLFMAARLFCTVGVHPTRCNVGLLLYKLFICYFTKKMNMSLYACKYVCNYGLIVMKAFAALTLVYWYRNLMRVGIQKNIFRHCCHWLKRVLRKERYLKVLLIELLNFFL